MGVDTLSLGDCWKLVVGEPELDWTVWRDGKLEYGVAPTVFGNIKITDYYYSLLQIAWQSPRIFN